MHEKVEARTHSCPGCGGRAVRRSVRDGFIEIVVYRLLALHPYRCEDCGFRFADRLQATNARSISNTHALPRIGLPEKDAQNYHQSAESKDYREQESKPWKQIDDAASR